MKLRTGFLRNIFRLSAKSRMAFGLAMLVVTILLVILVCGLVPDHREAAMRGRCALSELVALQIRPVILEKDLQRMEGLLEAIVARNDEILGGAVRRENGMLVTAVGEHAKHWNQDVLLPDDRQVFVPLNAAGQPWGRVEICFKPLIRRGMIGLLDHPWVRLVGLTGVLCCSAFYFYLRAMLNHLDPTGAVPKRVRSALDTFGEGLLILNRECKIVLVNQSLANSIGQSADKMVGMEVARLPWKFSTSNGSDLFPWVRALEEGRLIQGETIRCRRLDGGYPVFSITCSPVPGSDGTTQGVLVSLDDVTELEETRQQLSRAKDDAEAANQAKSAFLANMSHEIRTPMNAILGFTEVLRRGIERDEIKQREHLNTIHSSGTHLLTLINDILDLSKVEAGRLEVESIPCAVHQVVAEVVTVLRVRAAQKNISLDYQFDGKIPETIRSDPARLRQILTNLVGNAIKFTEKGGVRIVTKVDIRGNRPQMILQVVDTGIGMSEAQAAKIFDPFSQADASVTRRFGGTGLGLSISKRFAEALGGGISVTSEEGVGSVFVVRIDTGPLDGVAMIEPTEADVQCATSEQSRGMVRLPEMRILLVDDAEENRDLMSVILDEAGTSFETAENGLVALEMATSGDFDVILMDMNMPVMDGYTATRKLRAQGYDKPIIALTAHAMQSAGKECSEAGCTGFLTKPVDFDKLMTVLAEIAGVDIHDLPTRTSEPSTTQADISPAVDSQSVEPIHSTLNTNNPKFRAIVIKFVQRLPEQRRQMSDALAAGDFEQLSDLAHWLKGSGPNVGFADFAGPAKALEDSARAGKAEQAQRLLAQIQLLNDRVASGARAFDQPKQPKPVPAVERHEADSVEMPSPREDSDRREAHRDAPGDQNAANKRNAPTESENALVSTLPTDKPRFRVVVTKFVDRLDDHLRQLQQALDADNVAAVGETATWIKDASMNCGFAPIAETASELESCSDPENIAAIVGELNDLRQRIQVADEVDQSLAAANEQ